jgi:hypothetical protein
MPITQYADQPPARRRASGFFWGVLVFATLTSIAGNVAHALLNVRDDSTLMLAVAAVVAVIPPAVLLLATHSVGLLVHTRSSGLVYWTAVVITVVLAAFAFRLSFDALKELAVSAGVRPGIAWLWPLSVDLSIAQATAALLALTRWRPEEQHHADINPVAGDVGRAPHNGDGQTSAPRLDHTPTQRRGAHLKVQDINSLHCHDSPAAAAHLTTVREDPGTVEDGWLDVAESLICDKVTVKSVEETAEVLRLWDQKVPITTIATRTGVHRDTVNNIVKAAGKLLNSAARHRA